MTNGLCMRLPVGSPEAASLGDTISWDACSPVVPPDTLASSSSRKAPSGLPFSPTLEAGVAILLIVLSLSRVVGALATIRLLSLDLDDWFTPLADSLKHGEQMAARTAAVSEPVPAQSKRTDRVLFARMAALRGRVALRLPDLSPGASPIRLASRLSLAMTRNRFLPRSRWEQEAQVLRNL